MRAMPGRRPATRTRPRPRRDASGDRPDPAAAAAHLTPAIRVPQTGAIPHRGRGAGLADDDGPDEIASAAGRAKGSLGLGPGLPPDPDALRRRCRLHFDLSSLDDRHDRPRQRIVKNAETHAGPTLAGGVPGTRPAGSDGAVQDGDRAQPACCREGCRERRAGRGWWTARGSNPRPPRCERGALPAELAAQGPRKPGNAVVVGRAGFEPATSTV